jgi:hypothetical protein
MVISLQRARSRADVVTTAQTLTVVSAWRADGLGEVFSALDRGFGSLAILPVHGEATRPAIRVLVRAVKGGRAPTRIEPALMLNDELTPANERVAEILAGKKVLPLALGGGLLRKRLRRLLRRGSEVDRGQKRADQQHQ